MKLQGLKLKNRREYQLSPFQPFSGFAVFLISAICFFLAFNAMEARKQRFRMNMKEQADSALMPLRQLIISLQSSPVSTPQELPEHFDLEKMDSCPPAEASYDAVLSTEDSRLFFYSVDENSFALRAEPEEAPVCWLVAWTERNPRTGLLLQRKGTAPAVLLGEGLPGGVADRWRSSFAEDKSGAGSLYRSAISIDSGTELVFYGNAGFFELFPFVEVFMLSVVYLLFLLLALRARSVWQSLSWAHLFEAGEYIKSSEWPAELSPARLPAGGSEATVIKSLSNKLRVQARSAMEAVGAGLVLFNTGKIYFANKAALDLLSLAKPELGALAPRQFAAIFTSVNDDNPLTVESLLDEAHFGELRLLKVPHGDSDCWVQVVVTEMAAENGTYYFMTLMDQTRIREMEDRASSQMNFLTSILESISDPFYVIDANTREVVMSNKAARALMASKTTSCQALNPDAHDCTNKNQLCPFELSKLTKVSSLVERVHLNEFGEKRHFEIHGHPIVDENEEVTHVIEYQLDVTSRKRAESNLRESEERYSSLFEKNNSVMLLYDPESGRIVDANPAACEFYGYTREEFTSKHIVDINTMSPFELYREMLKAKEENRHQLFFEHRLASGELRFVETYVGLIRMSGRDLYYSIVFDITERRKAEQALQNLIELETLAAGISTRFIRLQADEIDEQIEDALAEIGHFASFERCLMFTVNPEKNGISSCYEWHEQTASEVRTQIEGMSGSSLAWIENKSISSPGVSGYDIRQSANLPFKEMQFWHELGIRRCHYIPFRLTQGETGLVLFERPGGKTQWSEDSDAFLRIIAELFSNALEKKYYESKLLENQEVLKRLSTHIHDEIESVRSNIAREVHDELGQLLTALKFDVRFLERQLTDQKAAVVEKLVSMEQVLDHAIQSVQRITAELRPVLLDDLGIGPAIEWHAKEFEKRTAIAITMDVIDVQVGSREATTLFRVCQEALTNIARHSGADRATISLSVDETGVRLKVGDNGRGITREEINSNTSFGIIGLKERVSAIGGAVTVAGQKGEGTVIDVWIPQKQEVETR